MFFVLFFDQNQLLYVFLRMSFNIAEISADVKPSQTSMKSHMCSIVLDQHEICTLQVTILTFSSFYYPQNKNAIKFTKEFEAKSKLLHTH